jgi:hypothetical protein
MVEFVCVARYGDEEVPLVTKFAEEEARTWLREMNDRSSRWVGSIFDVPGKVEIHEDGAFIGYLQNE